MIDSLPIAQHLDAVFPSSPRLFPSGDASYALFVAVSSLVGRVRMQIYPFIAPRIPDHLDPRGAEYFRSTRQAALGKPLADILPTDKETIDKTWESIERESAVLIDMLRGRHGKNGPFFEGEKAGYADLFFAAITSWCERFDKELFEKLMGLGNGEFKALYEACLPWLEGQGEEKEWPIEQTS